MPAPLVDGILQADSLAETSKTHYLEKLATITRLLGKPVDYLVEHPQHVVAVIKRRYTCPLTQRSFISAVKALFHHNEHLKVSKAQQLKEYTDFQNELSQHVTQRYMSAEPTDRERRNWVPWDQVLAKERELASSEYGSYDHLVLAMYCLIEPLRQDYGALRILADREPPPRSDQNFLVINKDATWGKLVLNSYKTAKKYGTYERQLPSQLLSVIRASLLAHPRPYLFVDESGQPYRKANSFTQFSNRTLKRLFDKNFTVSLMRHSHISAIDFNNSTPGDLFAKSRNMAHSIGMQQLYRRRVDPLPQLTVHKQPSSQPPQPPQPSQPPAGVTITDSGDRFLTLSV